jgi:CheY-like chemotaxis protein
VPEVDDDQLAALRRLRAAFGAIEIIEVISNDPTEEARMADPRRMTPEEQGEAHALLVKAVSDPDWQPARQAVDELMRKLLVVHRLLEAEERLAKRERGSEPG